MRFLVFHLYLQKCFGENQNQIILSKKLHFKWRKNFSPRCFPVMSSRRFRGKGSNTGNIDKLRKKAVEINFSDKFKISI